MTAPPEVALDRTVVNIDGEQHWLFAVVHPERNVIHPLGVYTARMTVATKLFLQELEGKHDLEEAELFVDGPPWLHAGLFEFDIQFQHEIHGDRNPVEGVSQEIKRRTNQFYINSRNGDLETVDAWLKALAFAEKQHGTRWDPKRTVGPRTGDSSRGARITPPESSLRSIQPVTILTRQVR